MRQAVLALLFIALVGVAILLLLDISSGAIDARSCSTGAPALPQKQGFASPVGKFAFTLFCSLQKPAP